MKEYTKKQNIIARSSAGTELYATALAASEAKRIESMMIDLDFAVKPVLIIDAKATEHILHRHGIGRMKHIVVALLWLQDEVKSERLRVRRVKSDDNFGRHRNEDTQQKNHQKHATAMGYLEDQESLESGGVMGLWIDESAWTVQSRSEQFSPEGRR